MTEGHTGSADGEFFTAASDFLESLRLWLKSGVVEHLAHQGSEPADCKICAAGSWISENAEPLLYRALAEVAQLADEWWDALARFLQRVFGDFFGDFFGGGPDEGGPAGSENIGTDTADPRGRGKYQDIDIEISPTNEEHQP